MCVVRTHNRRDNNEKIRLDVMRYQRYSNLVENTESRRLHYNLVGLNIEQYNKQVRHSVLLLTCLYRTWSNKEIGPNTRARYVGEQKLILIDKVRRCQRKNGYERYIKGVVVVRRLTRSEIKRMNKISRTQQNRSN